MSWYKHEQRQNFPCSFPLSVFPHWQLLWVGLWENLLAECWRFHHYSIEYWLCCLYKWSNFITGLVSCYCFDTPCSLRCSVFKLYKVQFSSSSKIVIGVSNSLNWIGKDHLILKDVVQCFWALALSCNTEKDAVSDCLFLLLNWTKFGYTSTHCHISTCI